MALRLLAVITLLAAGAGAQESGAECLTPPAQRLAQAEAAYRARFGDAAANETVAGLDLKDTPRAIAFLKRSLGHKPPQVFQRALDASCKSVLCALEQTLGDKESALWFLVVSAEVNAPPSLDQSPYDVESVWQPHELRGLARALLEAPAALKHVPNLKAWRRVPGGQSLKKGKKYNAVSYPKDADLFGLGTIVIRDTVWNFPQRDVRAVVQHELGHQWEFSKGGPSDNPVSLSEEWLSLSSWQSKNGGHALHDYQLLPGVQIATAFETTPGEDFADSVANYRFLPRLVKYYSKAKYQYLHRLLGEEHGKPPPFAELDAVWASIGGPLKSLRECGKFIQRATLTRQMTQTEMYIVLPRPKGTHWESVPRSTFVVKAGCIDHALASLQQTEGWAKIACRHDPEEVAVAVADRLEDAWGAFSEASGAIRGVLNPSVREACLAKRDLTRGCFEGALGKAAARRQASRILKEFGGDEADEQELAQELLVQTPLIPSDDELRARFPALNEPQALVFACLKGAVEISPKTDPVKRWVYWVELPPMNERRGFNDPLWNAACQRDFAAHLSEAGFKLEPGDKLIEHLGYLLKTQAGPLLDRFAHEVLQQTGALRTQCHVPASGSLSGSAGCARKWFESRLSPLLPDNLREQLADHLVSALKAR